MFPWLPVVYLLLIKWETCITPMIVSNCALPLVIPSGKQAVFHKMDAQFETRNRINGREC
jgi:hypothetical protein